jgi:two-component system sensor histidine kinase KdpD
MDNARLYREAQRVEAELRRANEAKDEFLGMVSHELRTSVTTIYGGANLLLSRASELDDETRISVLTDIRHESEQLVRMVRDMLLLARTELGQEIATEPVLIQRLIDRLIALRAVSNPRRRITLQADAELAPVVAEPAFLEQVLRNLLDNAEKYSPADTPVEIHVQRLDDEVVVCVADRGVGVPQDELEMIFDRFYRSTQSARSARGMGIGLSVCKRLVEAQGGRIWAEQREEGGLRVCFTLPFYRGDPDYL